MDDSHKDDERDDGAAVLVGRIIRSYREGMRPEGRRLSQENFLGLMVERGEQVALDLDRSTLSRWETGAKLAPQEFLEALGRTCDIPQPIMDLIMGLAGYGVSGDERERDSMLAAARDIESRVESVQQDVRTLMASNTGAESPLDASAVVKSTLRNAAIPGVFVLAVGFMLNALGQDGTPVLATYVLVVLVLVLGQGVLRWVKRDLDLPERDHIVDLFYISLFFTMNSSLLITALTRTDHFGFHTI